ncbi:MAG: AraC family transcriptional regulator [Eubacteriales bacterium]|nr:AraC family transcriptional regulator [Eubacteriales bacterium]
MQHGNAGETGGRGIRELRKRAGTVWAHRESGGGRGRFVTEEPKRTKEWDRLFDRSGGRGSLVDENYRETARHGTKEFPCAAYEDRYYNDFYPMSWHQEWEMGYVERGSMRVYVNGDCHLLRRGEGIFLNAGTLHAYAGEPDVEVLFPNLVFHPVMLAGSRDSVFWSRYLEPVGSEENAAYRILRPEQEWQRKVLEQIGEAFGAMRDRRYGWEFRVRERLSEAMLAIGAHGVCESGSPGGNAADLERLRHMISFLQGRYQEPVRVGQIAESAAISTRECQRIFRRVVGMTPGRYVTEMRLQQAKRLLAEGDLPLLEICARCGFQDQSYFTKLFREKTGSSPAKYRRQSRGR